MASSSASANLQPVVICGGGIIGCSIAYYLAKKGVKAVILEATGIASGASGKAGYNNMSVKIKTMQQIYNNIQQMHWLLCILPDFPITIHVITIVC